MVSTEERIQILRMVQEGKISPEEAAQLLEAIEEGAQQTSAPTASSAPAAAVVGGGPSPRWFRVRVTDTNNNRQRVNVRLPVSMVSVGLRMGQKFSPEVEGLDLEELQRAILNNEIGQIVDVWDDNDGEHVEVFLE